MANYKFSADIIADVLFRCGEPTDGSSDYLNSVIQMVNRAYRAIWNGGGEFDPAVNEDWLWLKKDPPGTLTLSPQINAGTVSATNNSTTITFSSAPAASVAGYFFKVDTHPDVFRISAHTGGSTTATLDSVFTDDTASGLAYKLFKAEYALASDVLRVMSPMRIQAEGLQEVDGVELSALERDWPLSDIIAGAPTQFAMVTESKIRFNKFGFTGSTQLIRIEYDYLYVPADLTNSTTEEPVVPLSYRHVIADMALFFLMQAKNDPRAISVAAQVKAGLQAMKLDNKARMVKYSRSLGVINPRPGYAAHNRRPIRTESGVIIG